MLQPRRDRRGNPTWHDHRRPRARLGVSIVCVPILIVLLALLLAGCASSAPCPDNAPDRPVTIAVVAPKHMRGVCGDAVGCSRIFSDRAFVYVPVGVRAWVLMHEARHAACGEWHDVGYVSDGRVGS